ncbi:MAG: hypothetical protein ACK2UY_06210 [Anaerolineae bacterium]
MKRLWKVVGIAVLVGVLGVALVGAVAFAQDDGDGSTWPFDFRERLHEAIAGVLGIGVDEYDAAVDTAQQQVLDEAVSEGVLTQEQADRIQGRADEGFGFDMKDGFFGGHGRGGMRGGFMAGGESVLLTVAAEQLGMTQEDLVAALQDGSTIADLAAEKGVELQDIVDAYVAQKGEDLAAAVEEGRITQEQADAMLEHLSEEVLERLQGEYSFGGPGLGGRGHHGGFGPGGMMPGTAPTLPGESES